MQLYTGIPGGAEENWQ